ncbi:hypothetical protein F5878DRAFT_117503 [Lentinula raphanica]|uniref:Uncharacterized protein n=1 Tax=Lentinula raphanica TaxID=153919 RepID=A0AA38UK92_9AGAR|nr:hypothetical protein F5878DRAFT_117503 [Lentinula raphanica]
MHPDYILVSNLCMCVLVSAWKTSLRAELFQLSAYMCAIMIQIFILQVLHCQYKLRWVKSEQPLLKIFCMKLSVPSTNYEIGFSGSITELSDGLSLAFI